LHGEEFSQADESVLYHHLRAQLHPGHERRAAVLRSRRAASLRNEIELGFKQVKWIKGIEFVAHYSEIGSGYGGDNQDHEFFGYRQSI
jgi:hypothetical protein